MRLQTVGFVTSLALALLAAPLAAAAQPPAQSYRIGYLGPGSGSTLPEALDAFRQQLRHLGYVEGQNLGIEYRWAADRDDQLPSLAADLVRLKVDVIVVEGHTPAIQAAKQATSTIPIVMGVSGDPVKTGLVESLARPGGNVTGLSLLTPELAPKRLELLKEAVPTLARVAVLWNAANPVKVLDWHETQAAASVLGLQLQSLEVRGSPDFDGAFDAATRDRAEALVVLPDGLINSHRKQIVDFATASRLPGMYPYREFVEAGGLMSYAPSYVDLFRRAAVYVDRILQGAKPADLPVEQPTKFELVLNRKTAQALGITFPPTLLILADEVIR
jgi:putative tryptophan/tyrosine transport system substrate-binding protein